MPLYSGTGSLTERDDHDPDRRRPLRSRDGSETLHEAMDVASAAALSKAVAAHVTALMEG